MTVRHHYVRKGDPDGINALERRGPFGAVDPGGDGAALLVRDGKVVAILPIEGAAGLTTAWRLAVDGARTLVVEEQFMAKNVQSTIRLARGAGVLVGMWAAACDYSDAGETLCRVVWVMPDTWARRALNLQGRPVRGQRKATAIRLADRDLGKDPRYRGATAAQRSGIADAYGVARWWLRLPPGRF